MARKHKATHQASTKNHREEELDELPPEEDETEADESQDEPDPIEEDEDGDPLDDVADLTPLQLEKAKRQLGIKDTPLPSDPNGPKQERWFRVGLKHNPTRIVKVAVLADGWGHREVAVAEYNRQMGIISSEHVHEVSPANEEEIAAALKGQ